MLFAFPKMKSVFIYKFHPIYWSSLDDALHIPDSGQAYMDVVMSLIQREPTPIPSLCMYGSNPAQHLEIVDACLGIHDLVDMIDAYPISDAPRF